MVKKITLEDLATMVAEGFNGVNERIDRLETRVGGLETRVGSLENKVDAIQYDVNVLKKDVVRLQEGQERIETTLRQVAWQSDYREMDYRVKKLEGARATA